MAASSIRVGAVQLTSTNDIEANFNTCSRLVEEASIAGAKLLCFPEAFSFVSYRDGESLEIAEPVDGLMMRRYCSMARYINFKKWMSFCLLRFDVHVPGNMVYKESNFTTPGHDIVVVDSPVGRLGLTVCYDLRFPELSRLLQLQHDAQAHWEILLHARAIETQCYVVAAAQAGKHNEKRESYGDSLIIDSWGRITARLPDSLSTGIAIADIDLSNIACED